MICQASSHGSAVHVDQQPHQLGDRDARMRVVELDRRLSRQRDAGRRRFAGGGARCPAARPRRRNIPAAAAIRGRRAFRRSDRGLSRSPRRAPARQRADMVAAVEHVEPQRIDGARRPQPQRVHVPAAPADDRRVVGDRLDGLVRDARHAARGRPADRVVSTRPPKLDVVDRPPAARTPTGCRRTASPRDIPAASRRG